MKETLSKKQHLARARCSNPETASKLKQVAFHHIDSFNYIFDEGLNKICQYLSPMEIFGNTGTSRKENPTLKPVLPFKKMKIWFESLSIGYPMLQGAETR